MGIEVSGLSERIAAIDRVAQTLFREMRKELIDSGAKMVTDARRDHNFTSRSGALERSIDAEVPADELKMAFGFIDDATRSLWKKAPHVTYGTFQHEGTGRNYAQSRAAGRYDSNPNIEGIKADHFLVRAWDRHIDGMKERLKSKCLEILKGAVEHGAV